jgi:arylsulfatase A-like enzyme
VDQAKEPAEYRRQATPRDARRDARGRVGPVSRWLLLLFLPLISLAGLPGPATGDPPLAKRLDRRDAHSTRHWQPWADAFGTPGDPAPRDCNRPGRSWKRRSRAYARSCRGEPNIVVIVGDDVDWRRLGFMGEDPRVVTPSLDSLASEGVTYRAGHLSASVCRQTHHHLLSGVHSESEIEPSWETLPIEMRRAGLQTFQAGKLWDHSAAEWGFDRDAGEVCPGGSGLRCGNPVFGREDWDVAKCGLLGDPNEPCPATRAWRDFLASVDLEGGERFFAFFSPRLPHTPYNPPAEYVALYAEQELKGVEPRYLPMLTWFDGLVGEILTDLESARAREDTVVIYLADNGYRSDAGLLQVILPERERGKNSLNEMGFRTPVIFSWPKVMRRSRGSFARGVVGLEDVFATLLALVGRPVPAEVQGFDLSRSWLWRGHSPRRALVTYFRNGAGPVTEGWVVRTPKWRYTWDLLNEEEHLHAIRWDVDEEVELIDYADEALLERFDRAIEGWEERNR